MPMPHIRPRRRQSFGLIETLESRTLFAAAYLGIYTGIDTYTFDGKTHKDTETVVISALSKTSSYTTSQANNAQIAVAHSLGPLAYESLEAMVFFGESPFALPSKHARNANDVSPLATSDFIASFPNTFGSGTIQIDGNSMTVMGTVDTGIFMPTVLNFAGTKVAAKAALPASAPAADPKDKTLFTTLSLEQTLSLNPAIGTFLGHMTRASDSIAFKTSAVVAKNSKGHTAITFQLIEPGIGVIHVQSVIHPTHTGAFTLPLGNSVFDGTLSGHVTHTGRMVLHLNVPEFSSLVGTQVRHH